MGKTVESYRIALDKEVQRWIGYARALRQDDRKRFEQLMDIYRNYASASSNATRPVLFEPMIMSIVLHQQKTLNKLEKELVAIRSQSYES
ncbi:MAG: hypothetical protein P8Y18_04495 [Candidatus Bathyarchaeota archaeon]